MKGAGLNVPPLPLNDDNREAVLTRTEAEYRKSVVANVRYGLDVLIDPKQDAFSGKLTLAFDYKMVDSSRDLRLDFYRGTIKHAVVNGSEIAVAELSPSIEALLLPCFDRSKRESFPRLAT